MEREVFIKFRNSNLASNNNFYQVTYRSCTIDSSGTADRKKADLNVTAHHAR